MCNIRLLRVRPRCRSGHVAAAATGAVEITLPVAIVAAAYIIGQGLVDDIGDSESQFIGESWQEERKIASAVGKIALAIK